jgi:hypothetical protein
MRPVHAALLATLLLLTAPIATAAVGALAPATGPAGAAMAASSADVLGAGSGTDLVADVSGYYVPNSSGATFVPLAPVRLLDTRSGNGLSGTFATGVPRAVQIAGRGGVPAGALAVTVNVTVTGQTSAGYVAVGPTMSAAPATSTLNFPAGDNRANGTTVALDPSGRLAAVFKGGGGSRTHLVLDVTGYFLANPSGATFVPLAFFDRKG